MPKKSLTDAEIENELNEFYANSESEDEFSIEETDEALEDFEIEPQEQCKIRNLFQSHYYMYYNILTNVKYTL